MTELARMKNLANSGLLRLPPEILDDILEDLSPADIWSCSLTSSLLYPLARSRTLRSIDISLGYRQPNLKSLLRATWFTRHARELYKHTRSFTVRDGSSYTRSLLPSSRAIQRGDLPKLKELADVRHAVSDILASIPNLHTFCLAYSHYRDWPPTKSIMFPTAGPVVPVLATVTTLTVLFTTFPSVTAFYDILCSFPSITRLNVSTCIFNDPATKMPVELYGKLPLVHLWISHNTVTREHDNYSLLHELTLCAISDNLRSITCTVPQCTGWDSILQGPVRQSLTDIEFLVAWEYLPLVIGAACMHLNCARC